MKPECRKNHGKKKRFRDEIAALMAITNIANHGADTGKRPIRTYKCRFCGGWFLTSKEFRR